MLPDYYRFRNVGPYTRTIIVMKNYNTGFFGRHTKKDLPLDFLAQEIDRSTPETHRIAKELEKKGYLRIYPSLEDSTEIMVSAYSPNGRRLI